MTSIDITAIQLNIEHKNKVRNVNAIENILASAEQVGDITLLPELFSTGYVFESPSDIHLLCEEFDNSPTINRLAALASSYQTTFVAGIAEREGTQYFNSVAVVDTNGLQYKYRKISQTQIDKQYFSRGNERLIFECNGVKIGVVICFDIWFPEIMRQYIEADIILHPSNFGGEHSFSLSKARALENGQYVMTCNRIGSDVTNDFTAAYCGNSRLFSPKGETIFTMGEVESCQTISIRDFTLAPQWSGTSPAEESYVLSELGI